MMSIGILFKEFCSRKICFVVVVNLYVSPIDKKSERLHSNEN